MEQTPPKSFVQGSGLGHDEGLSEYAAHIQSKDSCRLHAKLGNAFFEEENGRAWLLRGVNLSGSSKFPRYPVPVPSHVRGDAFLGARRKDGRQVGRNQESPKSVPLHESSPDMGGNDALHHDVVDDGGDGLDLKNESKGDRISFIGRPFELDEADEHLARLRHWGFRLIRWVVTWEAIEHEGPGKYDREFLEYTVKALLKAKEYGFKVIIDFHQDVWSRYSGGSGAPLWTFHLAGLDPHHFHATGAAAVHNALPESEPMPRMVWLTNYYKLACATMFTLFYAGTQLAPRCNLLVGIDKDNSKGTKVHLQDFLQDHFLGAIRALADSIHGCRDDGGQPLLEDSVVLGYDSWNEPSCGWIGLDRLDVLPEQHDLRQGDMPTPFQTMLLGQGFPVTDVATYRLELVGPIKTGSRTIDPSLSMSTANRDGSRSPVTAWLDKKSQEEYDALYGIQRDVEYPTAGECLWAQHGVWSVQERKILQQDYFAVGPRSHSDSTDRPRIRWVEDHWMHFARRVTTVVREVHKTAILFLEPPVYVPPPNLIGETSDCSPKPESINSVGEAVSVKDEPLTLNMVYTPHHYDDLVLLTKRYLGWVNIDLLGLSRGRHKSLMGSVVLGKRATESLFGQQIKEIQSECYQRLGKRPVLIGETGLHFDVGLGAKHQAGNTVQSPAGGQGKKPSKRQSWFQSLLGRGSDTPQCDESSPSQQNALARSKSTPLSSSSTHHPGILSKQFQQAFDNILNGLDGALVHYTLWNYTIENDAAYGDGWNGENLSLYSKSTLPPSSQPSCSSGNGKVDYAFNQDSKHPLDVGGRAVEQFCRPYPVATIGRPIRVMFDRHLHVFRLWTVSTTRRSSDMSNRLGGDLAINSPPDVGQTWTEIYVPRIHFLGRKHCTVRVSDGSWEWDEVRQLLFWRYADIQDDVVMVEGREGIETTDEHEHWLEIVRR
ncbi:hypothetical protein BGW38_004425 [Lunasporangiospora selenospora]|uniref:Cellulase (Glycosyl hydrolase family 5) n=1 Tax=Lunasporangiospora selenospora TaxID=979761 RepID=A0A9P6G020_9FUNG|nr:hypothetical protein BGW38_004425 [Lunasporangiospora selenospora]